MNRLFVVILVGLLFITCSKIDPTGNSFYVNSAQGSDSNDGKSPETAWKSLERTNMKSFEPGDKLLFCKGCTFFGTLVLENVSGTRDNPITISSYEDGSGDNDLPIIDAKGFANGVLLLNCSHIVLSKLEITANGKGLNATQNNNIDMRCGVLVTTSEPKSFENILLKENVIRDIFFENEGFERSSGEVHTPNGTQSYGWGIRFINKTEDAYLKGMTVESCEIINVAHTGIKFTGKGKRIQNVKLYNNQVQETGGPGIQMSNVQDGHVKDNAVNYSGSNNDSRKWGRGSGLWTWGCADIVIENNSFRNANGPADSAGCHIDFNCNNVIVQYNLSENNAGGFCEILGNNFNCAYRYNVSINDGHRVKGANGAFQEGKIFWLSGFAGKNNPRTGPFNSYFYNNTIYVKKDIVVKIAVDRASSGVFIANNIFYFEGKSELVIGDQYKPDSSGESLVENIVFQNNLYLKERDWPLDVLIQDSKPITGNPEFANAGGIEAEDYFPGNTGLIKDKGIQIYAIPNDEIGLFIGLGVEHDIIGNEIKGLPDLGAIEIK
ncbi:MAG: right-handed parallel beta-helix repeat-containing protein [Bacteroidetes bacterium]|nr:right-handed parallel beta-helix repeat-containing protein [Bacteroidota bacterium]